MSLAPFWIADISTTLTSWTTGASSPCLASASALISCELLEDLDVVRSLVERLLQLLEAAGSPSRARSAAGRLAATVGRRRLAAPLG